MHSSSLRGSDFHLTVEGAGASHADIFADFAISDRLGIVAHHPLDGLGAAALILAHVTAFYDRLRDTSEDFVAYPDFFTFQPAGSITGYGMLDIWPKFKDVALSDSPWESFATISSRAISILVVPESNPKTLPAADETADRATLHSLERTVRRCYTYSPDGSVSQPDCVIRCKASAVREWGTAIIDRADRPDTDSARSRWESSFTRTTLEQSFRRIDLPTALAAVDPTIADGTTNGV